MVVTRLTFAAFSAMRVAGATFARAEGAKTGVTKDDDITRGECYNEGSWNRRHDGTHDPGNSLVCLRVQLALRAWQETIRQKGSR